MAIIVEDGSIVANANSYISLADAQTLVDNLGYSVTLVDANLLRAMAVLNVLDYCGYRSDESTQALPFPRSGVVLSDDRELETDEIPQELKNAQSILAAEINAGNDPTAMRDRAVKYEKVDVIEVEYLESTLKRGISIYDMPLVWENLRYLVCTGGAGMIGRA